MLTILNTILILLDTLENIADTIDAFIIVGGALVWFYNRKKKTVRIRRDGKIEELHYYSHKLSQQRDEKSVISSNNYKVIGMEEDSEGYIWDVQTSSDTDKY